MLRLFKGVKLKPLFKASGYSYTSASGLARKGKKAQRTAKEIFADGVEFGRSIERESRLR